MASGLLGSERAASGQRGCQETRSLNEIGCDVFPISLIRFLRFRNGERQATESIDRERGSVQQSVWHCDLDSSQDPQAQE